MQVHTQNQSKEHLHNIAQFRRQIDVGTFWSASVKVRRGTVPKDQVDLQIRSVMQHMQLSPWLKKRLDELLELNAKRV